MAFSYNFLHLKIVKWNGVAIQFISKQAEKKKKKKRIDATICIGWHIWCLLYATIFTKHFEHSKPPTPLFRQWPKFSLKKNLTTLTVFELESFKCHKSFKIWQLIFVFQQFQWCLLDVVIAQQYPRNKKKYRFHYLDISR